MALGFYIMHRLFGLKQRKMEIEAEQTAEKAAQYAVSNHELEQRVRVLEQIVTDGGAHTAAQIEALRDLQDRDPLPLPKEKARG
ncbi:hypothetical protein MUY73_01360 [Sphingomicrobium aestuariivivum]|nr:hypothetical protein [Sphingomicrobium aestuariivivum]MCJ8189990.1 hypothetical protein [Sphingomicrobium aestuariivivum]